jgi:hypothetical protein
MYKQFQIFRKALEPDAPEPLASYRYETHEICDENGHQGLEYTLYGPEGHEGLAHDWIVANVIGAEAMQKRKEPGHLIKFRYFEE